MFRLAEEAVEAVAAALAGPAAEEVASGTSGGST
jgi:hypothetical protein